MTILISKMTPPVLVATVISKLNNKELFYIRKEVLDLFTGARAEAGYKDNINRRYERLIDGEIATKQIIAFLRRSLADAHICSRKEAITFLKDIYHQKKYYERNSEEEKIWKR